MKKYFLLTCLTAAVISVGAFSILFVKDRPQAADGTFVRSQMVVTSSGLDVRITNPKQLSEVVNRADHIVKGELVATQTLEEEYKLEEGTPEKEVADRTSKKSTGSRIGTNYIIKVTDVIKGQVNSPEITMYLSEDFESFNTKLNTGDQYIFLLKWNETIGRYVPIHPQASYFQVGADHKVKPMYKGAAEFSGLEGRSYDEVKKKIRDADQPH